MTENKSLIKSITQLDTAEERLAQTVLNSLSANIAILDRHGRIVETNRAWRAYADRNQLEGPNDSVGDNYLEICDRTGGEEAEVARQVAAGIRAVLEGEIREFVLDYPCHSPSEEHWYYLRALRMSGDGPVRVVVSHEEITALKKAERALRLREQERDRLRHAMRLAMEVQQTLLPRATPSVPGIDLAGRSIYCDETGGDYYDYLLFGPAPSKTLGIFIGDVSGHGISSALLMAAARASLRQRASTPGRLADIIGDVNRQITRDLIASGQFITLLGMQLTPQSGRLVWVRAGHEPALLYRAREDRFESLVGEGAAPLGLETDAVFSAN
ncbi:MAG: SpoIIE family protein phosphatase, partial [Desulfobacterales bacterium]|nr:SpoIIE family protein phosphatase [Desulfobacterales bacterium]